MRKSISPKVIVIVGPTASGKSDLGIKLAKKFNGEIISADSRQVYRGMDIGTGKVSKKEQKIVPHHLIDVASPKKQFTADDFKKLGQKAIDDILSRGKVPIIVGGTGFYIDVLLGRMSVAEVPPNNLLRSDLNKFTVEQLFERLRRIDPQRAKTIEPKNKRRLIRALEIVLTTDKPVPSQKLPASTNYAIAEFVDKSRVLWIGVKLSQKVLEKRIKKRLDARLKPSYASSDAKALADKQGMIKEVKNLLKSGVSKKRLYDFGLEYRQISEYLASEKFKVKSLKNFKQSEHYDRLLRSIIKYSKRQMTWFKKNREIYWLKNHNKASRLVKAFVSRG